MSNSKNLETKKNLKNQMAIKALIRWTHFLACHHIPHTTNFDERVDLILRCGAEDLKWFLERVGKNATHMSKTAVVEFDEAVGYGLKNAYWNVFIKHPTSA